MDIQLSLQEICDFFMQSADIVYTHSSEGIINSINKNIENRIGYTSEEIIGRHFVDFIHPEDIHLAVEVFEKAKINEPSSGFLLRIRHKDGRFLYFDFKSHAIIKGGVYLGGIGMGQDITAKVITEEALGISEKIYKVVVDNAQDVIYTVAPDGTVTSVNDFMKNVTGWSAHEVIGKQYTFFIHPDDIHYAIEVHEMIMKGLQLPVVEMRFLKKDGSYLIGEFSTTPLFYNSKFLGTLGIGRDVSEKKKSEENLKLALLKERHLNELKKHFISMVSHDFRTPLTIISGMSELIESKYKDLLDADTKEYFMRIKENVKRMSKTLTDIVMVSGEESNDAFNPAPVKIMDYCSNIVNDAAEVDKKPGRVILKFSDGVTADTIVDLDQDIMRHILLNLLGNALKYSDYLPVDFFVDLSKEGFAIFTISDKGIGIPPEFKNTIFQYFMRAANVGHIKGSGLGLAIVKNCVDIHKGEINIISELNHGTTVCVKIPLVKC